MSKKIDVADFVDSIKADVDEFFVYWVSHNKENPTDWPLNLTENEWLEQYESWATREDWADKHTS